MRVRRASLRVTSAILVVTLLLTPSAGAHQDAPIGLEAREDEHCLSQGICLELVSLPADLQPGHATSLELRVHQNASQTYTAALTTLEQADPDREATPASAALATTPAGEPGQTVHVNLTAPEASHAYVWLTGDDHEARGGWETFPLGMQDADGTEEDRLADGAGLAATLVATLAALAARRRGPE